jgi:hypothetical protein
MAAYTAFITERHDEWRVDMNATTTISTRNTADGKFGRLFRAFCQEALRAIELVGASYRSGPLNPL